ncbi:MAG: patatin-like phospholipase family protein [Aeromicrobium sp.]|uniref:patatin-like phospholipase family protein n=1 Tax=Aeromicrobium sp. TaxID=1871063 RepID=UPI0039E4FAE5
MAIRRGVVIGCGGTLGFAWTAVMLAEVERALDWDVREADLLIGTSAGAEMVAMLGAGRAPAQILAALDGEPDADPVLRDHLAEHPGMVPPVPGLGWPGVGVTRQAVRNRQGLYTGLAGLLPRGRADATWLRTLGDRLANAGGWVDHPATWIIGLDTRSGQRAAFGAPGHPAAGLGEAIAASWAIPGWFPPVHIDGRDYFDGGTASPTSADLALPAELDEVVIVAPMTTSGGVPGRGAHRVERLLRRQMTAVLDREQAALEAAGVRVIRVEPGTEELHATGPNFMDLRRREATLAVSRRVAPRRIADAIERTA